MYVAIDRMGQWCDASTMALKTVGKEVDNSMTAEAQGMLHRNQAVKELHRNQAVKELHRNQAVKELHRNQAVKELHRNQAVKELHRNQAVKELHRNQAVKELHRNQAVKELIKPWIFYGRIVGTSAIRQPESVQHGKLLFRTH